ncbi:hypothetical protein IID24_04140, partial [Patescibacteria group bacterium]|nr:hypothetical protein [Patescibacteria group bacterium]
AAEIAKAKQEVEKAKAEAEKIRAETAQLEVERLQLENSEIKAQLQRELKAQKLLEDILQRAQDEEQLNQVVESPQAQQKELQQAGQTNLEQRFEEMQNTLNYLTNQINTAYQQKTALEQQYNAEESEFVTLYCENKEEEINRNYASRGLYSSGARLSAIQDLKILCPPEARAFWNALMNEDTALFVIQLQNMQTQFIDYNRSLYSACSEIYSDCSIYFDAAFPVNF